MHTPQHFERTFGVGYPAGRQNECRRGAELGQPEWRKPLIDELKSLREGQGATLGRLGATRLVASLLPGEGALDKRLREALESLGARRDIAALLNAYGYGPTTDRTVTRRRETFASLRGISFDTVKRAEARAINDLAVLLMPEQPADSGTDDKENVMAQVAGSLYDWLAEEAEAANLRDQIARMEQKSLVESAFAYFKDVGVDISIGDDPKWTLEDAFKSGPLDSWVDTPARIIDRFMAAMTDPSRNMVASHETITYVRRLVEFLWEFGRYSIQGRVADYEAGAYADAWLKIEQLVLGVTEEEQEARDRARLKEMGVSFQDEQTDDSAAEAEDDSDADEDGGSEEPF